jgi:very-short-patch-repair endonuclease
MTSKGVLRDRARGMRKQPSQAERALWEVLRGKQLGAKFRRQHPVASYIADFACIEARLIVEIDGRSHDDQANYDEARTLKLAESGWRVLRVRDHGVLTDPQAVIATIAEALRR